MHTFFFKYISSSNAEQLPCKRLSLSYSCSYSLTFFKVSGVLRASAARVNPSRIFPAAGARFFCNLSPQTHRIPGSLVSQGRFHPFLYQPCSHRMLSLGSIFSRSKPTAAPTPLVVAHITRLEAEANVHPHDVPKQLMLFEALLSTNLKSSYELVITRWEKMCEFVSSVFGLSILTNINLL